MRRAPRSLLTALLALGLAQAGARAASETYRDPQRPIDERVRDLLSRMTLEEKVAQLTQKRARDIKMDGTQADAASVAALFGDRGPGVLCVQFGEDAAASAHRLAAGQRYLREKTRLGIPALTVNEGLHGLLARGATIYPQFLALGCTWNPDLARRMGEQIADEATVAGVNHLLTPMIEVVRDPRSVQLDGETWQATEIARENFANDAWRQRWIIEGDAACAVRDGRLRVATNDQPGASKAATLWWREPLPADVLIELTAGAELPAENNAANLNLFFHARELDGSPYRFGRSSNYAEYQAIPNYIATLTGGFQDGWSRLRRNPGFRLLSEEKSTRAEPGRTYRIRLLIAGGRLRYWLDGRLVHDGRDPQPLPGGHFALRTWRSRVWWSDVTIHALSRAPAPAAAADSVHGAAPAHSTS